MALLKKQRMAGLLTCAMIAGNMSGVMAEVTESNGVMRTVSSQVEVTTGAQIKVLNASEIQKGNIESEISINGFTITPGPLDTTTKVAVDEHSSEQTAIDGEKFIRRLKLGGGGNVTERSIIFSTSGKAKVTIYAMSGNNTATNRYLKLCSIDGKEVATAPQLNPATTIHKQTLTIDEAGRYALVSAVSGINIYRVIVEELEEGQEESRKPWSEVESPAITQVIRSITEKSTLNVSYTGLIGIEGADQIIAKLYDEAGKMVSQKATMAEGTEGTIALTYATSGKYTVQLEASRESEEIVKTSKVFEVGHVLTDLPASVIISSVLTGDNNSLDIKWNAIDEIEYYEVAYKEAGADDSTYTVAIDRTTELSCNIPNLTIGSSYTIKITGFRGEDKVVGTVDKKVEAERERWTKANVGSGAAGTVTVEGMPVNGGGSVTINAKGGKMADSEDGFTYYYTEVDPDTENFTMTATFVMDDVDSRDNQSGFGIIALDTLVTGDESSRYYNSAGAMFTKFLTNNGATSKYGFPGGRFITGYTGAADDAGPSGSRKNIDSSVFDINYRDEEFANTDLVAKPRFFKGEEYTLTLRKSNTGYHASMTDTKTGEQIGEEVICYEPDLLLKQDGDKTYVGVFASRKIQVTVKDITFKTIAPELDDPKQERPMTYIDPVMSYDATLTSATTDYEAAFKSNVNGTIVVKDAEGNTVATLNGKNIDRNMASLKLEEGKNTFKAILTPSPRENQSLAVHEELSSYEPIEMEFTVTNKSFGTSENALYVRPDGKASAEGTKASPLDIYTAVAYAQPGQEIVLLGGTYELTQPIVIERGNSGKAGEPITLMSDPNERAVLDFSKSSAGFTLKGDYWHFYGFDICNAAKSPIRINGNNNIAEKLTIYNNADTGLQISGFSSESTSMWPSNNLVVSCESYNNADELGNDADGFAAKLTVGTGNVFRYCISHHNIDDGWDLYAKSTTGSIGQVIVEDSVAYANGSTLLDPSKTGEGNGFKLGGESMPGNHILRNSISFANIAKGITSNSGPDCQLFDNTSYGNGAENVSLYTNGKTTNYVIQNIVTSKGGKVDKYDFKNQEWTNDGSVYINGSNGQGKTVSDSWFKSVDTTTVPEIVADGSIDMKGLLELSSAAEGKGAVFTANPNPTVIEIGKQIGGTDEMLENKNWIFTANGFGAVTIEGKTGEAHGLVIDATKGKFAIRSTDVQINAGTIVKVPVDGASTITFTHGYSKGDILVTDANGYEKLHTFDSSNTWKEDAFAYEGKMADYITLEFKGNYYLRNLSVKAAEAEPRELQVGPTAKYKTVQSALNAIDYMPTENSRVTLSIAPGVYEEEVTVTKPYITFKNADSSKGEVKITYDKASGHDSDPAKNKGTQDSASVTIVAAAKGFEAYDITFENSYNLNQDKLGDIASARKQTQAVAVVTFADQIIFENCKFIGRQDTLYLKGSAKGQNIADANEARVYLKDCYIEGTVDFVFGDSTAVFENCELHMAYYTNGGHYTAPNTTLSNVGYVFNNCEFTISKEYAEYIDAATGKFKLDEKGNPVKNIDLGRPWQADHTYPNYGSQSVMINCKMDNAIAVDGWKAWDSNTVTNKVRFMEYNSMDLAGNLLDLSSRLNWVRILEKEQATAFNTVNVLRGSDNWNPSNGDLSQALVVADVTLDQYRIELPAGEAVSLNAKVLPVLAANKVVTWKSSDSGIATVDASGKVTAISTGKVEITATTEENRSSVTAEITVLSQRTQAPKVKEIKVEANETILPGDVLKGSYTYEKESDNLLDNAKVQWFIVDPTTGEEMLVQEGTETFDREYRVASGDIGYQIKFAVLPETKTTYGNVGEIVKAEATAIVSKPDYKVPELYVRESFTNFGDKYEGVAQLNAISDKKWIGINAGKAGNTVDTALTLLHKGTIVSSGKVTGAWKVVDTSGKAETDAAFNGNAAVASNIEYQNDASILVYNANKVWTNYTAHARMRFSPLATGYSALSYWDMYIDYSVETNSGYKVRISRGGNTNSVVVELYKVENGVEIKIAEDKSTLANKLKQNAGEENPFFRVEMSNNFGTITTKVYLEGTEAEGAILTFTDEVPLAGTVAFESFGKSGCPVMDMLTVEEIVKDTELPVDPELPVEPEVDKEAPVFNYTGKTTIQVAYGQSFKIPEITATDNIDKSVAVSYVIKNSKGEVVDAINTKSAGQYTIIYTAKDQVGNATTLEIKVVVAAYINNKEDDTSGTTSSSGSSSTGAKPSVDKSILEKIEAGKLPVVEVGSSHKVEVKSETLDKLINAGLGLVVKGQGVEINLNNYFLNSAQVIGASQPIQVVVAPVETKMAKAIEEQVKADAKLEMIGNTSMMIDLSVKVGALLTSFNEPLALSFDLAKVKVEDPSKLTLVSYEQQADGSIKVVKLGGKYDPVAQTFSALVAKPGQFGIVAADDLLKVNLTIGSAVVDVNDAVATLDVAPQIVEGRTMVPLRFIAESLNAEVKWDAKLKKVTIVSEGKTIELQVGTDAEYVAIIKDNRTLVPIRYISEQLDANVLWIPSAKIVEIVK